MRDPNKPLSKLRQAEHRAEQYKAVLLDTQKRRRELEALTREVAGTANTYRGPAGAKRGLELFSRLAETGWFKRARAALTS